MSNGQIDSPCVDSTGLVDPRPDLGACTVRFNLRADQATLLATPAGAELLAALATALTARAAVAAALPADAAARAAVQADSRRRLETTPEGAALTAAMHARDAAEDAERAADNYFEHVQAELDHAPDGDSSLNIEPARSALRVAMAARDASVEACRVAQETFSARIDTKISADFFAADAALCAAVKEDRRADAALQAAADRLGLVVSSNGLGL
jgi:hypothetical protein